MLRRLVLMLVLFACAYSPARAQLPQRDDDSIIVIPTFGFDGIMPAERWAPIRFTITSPQQHIVGLLSLSYPQDGSQAFIASMPATLTAGTPTPVDFIVCLPRSVDRITLSMRNDRGRDVFTQTFNLSNFGAPLASGTPSSDALFVPPSLVDERMTILSLGNQDLIDASELWSRSVFVPSAWNGNTRPDGTLEFEQRYRLTTLAPESAFTAWAAYDGLVALVADASTLGRLPERARRELLQWLHGGGTLILHADDHSDSWRRWLPPSAPWDVLTLDEVRTVDTPETLAALVPAHAKSAGFDTDTLFEPAPSLSARAVRLTDRGAQLGFEVLWSLDDQRSLAARGPVGFGTLVVLGFDPAHLSGLRSASGAAGGWAATLNASITHDSAPPRDMWSYRYSSGASARNAQSISNLIDAAVIGAGISPFTLVAVVLVLIVMALAIGPFDALLLKRRAKRHWSWLTASGWIAACSGFMLIFPSLQRSDTSTLTRNVITDAVLDEHAAALVSWKTGLNIAYAGQNGLIGPVDERPGAWWRGVSPLEGWFYNTRAQTLTPLRALQQPLPGPDGARASCLPQLAFQRVWTVRATLDRAADLPPIVARVTREDSNYTAHLGEADLRITSLRVLLRDGALAASNSSPGQSIPLTRSNFAVARSDDADDRSEPTLRDGVESTLVNAALADLPGPDTHTDAIERMLRSGRHALVVIEYETDQPDVQLVGADIVRCRGAVRLVVPIIDSPQEPSP